MNRRLLLTLLLPILIFTALALFNYEGLSIAQAATDKPNALTQGTLLAVDSSGEPQGPCPLKRTEVKAEVSGFISRVTVTQEFENPFEEKIEAVYTFPLPQEAAVDDMTMLIGERVVKGKIMRKEEAQAAYAEAKSRGALASLLDQERPNIFTQSVANITPGQQIKVTISYVEVLKYEEGSYEWSFPMVVGQRYIPGGSEEQTNGPTPEGGRVPDASRITPPMVAPGERPGHDISIEVSIDAGVPIEGLNSLTHEVEVERPDDGRAVVRLKDRATIPNKDFILKYDVAGLRVEDAVLAHRSARGGFFTLILQPPDRVTVQDVTPKELVFVLDTSGSMSGFPIEKARETMILSLDHLYPQDTFNVITFAGETKILFSEPVPATPENLRKAKKFLADTDSDGGTEMMKAIRAALKPTDSQTHLRITCFMTDGYVGNDMEIIGEVQKYQNARVFSMGFGESPNRFLLDKMAEYGRGEVEYITEKGDSAKAAQRFHQRVREPLLTDISVEYVGLAVADVYPRRIPDLFSAKPLILSGRYDGGGQGIIRLKGKMSGRDFVREIPVNLPEADARHDVLATLWARRRIDDLMGQDMKGLQRGEMKAELREAITRLGLDHRLMTQFTSFVAVEDAIATNSGEPRRVDVPTAAEGAAAAPGVITGTNIPSGVMAQVTVSSEGHVLNTTSSSVSSNVEVRTVQDLPVHGRSYQSFVALAPGVISAGTTQPSNSPSYNFSVNGQRPRSNNFVIDGVDANVGISPGGQNPGASAAGTTPGLTSAGGTNGLASINATQEVTIRTFTVEPQYGRVSGGQVEVVTRAGTNAFHGSLFEYFGNDALDAGDWFANSRGLGKPARRLNDFGGTFGGPLKRDRTFFFASYEGLRLRHPVVAVTDVPSLSARLRAPGGLQPFLNAYPRPNGVERPDGFAEFASGFSNPARLDASSFRLDHMWNSGLALFARYNYAASQARERGVNNSSLNTLNTRRSNVHTLTGSATYTISPSVVAELRTGYSRFTLHRSDTLDEFGGATIALGQNLAFFSNRNGSNRFDLDGQNAALSTSSDVANTQRQFNSVGSVSIVNGEHTLKFGADYRRVAPIIGLQPSEQSLLFNGLEPALAGVATRIGSYTRATPVRPVFHNLSVYGQDEWKLTPRLTLTYGLRWEVNPPPTSTDGQDALAVTQVNDLARLSLEPLRERLWKTTYGNLAPRFGLAYQLSKASDRELVVRAGIGLFYDLGSGEAGQVFADSFPFVAGQAVFNSPFPATFSALPVSGSSVPGDVPFSAFDPHLKLPYALKWDVSLERALGPTQTLSLTYAGAAGKRLLLTQSLFDRNPDFNFIRLTTNGARSDYHALQAQFNRRFSNNLQASVSYTFSKSLDDFSEDSAARTLLRGDGPTAERGPSDFDVRHVLTGFATYRIPSPFDEGLGHTLLRNWTINSIFNARSARPVNVIYGFPTSYGFAYLRPDLVAGVPLYLNDPAAAGGRRINPDAFTVPVGLRQGTLGRNSLRGFPLYQVDFALRRRFAFTEFLALEFGAEAFNLFNRANFEDPAGGGLSLGSRLSPFDPLRLNTTFGRSASVYGRSLWGGAGSSFESFYHAGGPRTFQFSLKLEF
ncbi:MAG TPA: TonB-dependent receptor [Pyrinomonadaceae bacterium]